jgi:hypothetical protein
MVRTYDGMRRAPRDAVDYLLAGRELENFTYDIRNTSELATFLADAYGIEAATAARYIDELRTDTELDEWLATGLTGRKDRARAMPFGRRLGWYACVRISRPEVVVETGVHDGLGSTALLRALERNAADGAPGELLGFDINPEAGWLIPKVLRSRYTLTIGDALSEMPTLLHARSVGLFIHDSDHRYEHEIAELDMALGYMGPGATLMSDNSHATTALRDLCERRDLVSRFWREVPKGHFYPGAGIGLAVLPQEWTPVA